MRWRAEASGRPTSKRRRRRVGQPDGRAAMVRVRRSASPARSRAQCNGALQNRDPLIRSWVPDQRCTATRCIASGTRELSRVSKNPAVTPAAAALPRDTRGRRSLIAGLEPAGPARGRRHRRRAAAAEDGRPAQHDFAGEDAGARDPECRRGVAARRSCRTGGARRRRRRACERSCRTGGGACRR